MSNAGFTRLEQLRDVESLNHYATAVARGEKPADVMRALAAKGRDNARVPMSWDASPGAGFTTGTPWLETHPMSGTVNAAAQVDDPDWPAQFDGMIAYATNKGWLNALGTRVRAHLER